MKQLKFSPPSPKLILEGKKTSTWRINDKRELKAGDIISLCDNNGGEFGKATVTEVKVCKFDQMTEEDKRGHEQYTSNEKMYQVFSKYYNTEVGSETNVSIIRFRLLNSKP